MSNPALEMYPFAITLSTNGSGLWSDSKKTVDLTALEVDCSLDEFDNPSYGELRVYFDVSTWDVYEDGLIYTDKKFMQELQKALTDAGFVGDDVYYSEQGMQGDNYVSCDVGADFLNSWLQKYGGEFEPYDW